MKRRQPKRGSRNVKAIRANVTFEFDERKVREADIQDRLDSLLCDEFVRDVAVEDFNVRWVSNVADSPLFGAARMSHATRDGGGAVFSASRSR